jgi:arylsulfatase A-like enzyme
VASPARRLLWGGLGGALVALSLWGSDLAALAQLRFAGVSDARAEERVVAAASPAIVGLERRLALIHLSLGFGAGALAAGALGRRLATARLALAAGAATTLLLLLLAMLGTVARYPQLYADRVYTSGGPGAAAMRVVTHALGPYPFDVPLVLVLAVLASACAFRLSGGFATPRARGIAAAVIVVVAARVAATDPRRGLPAASSRGTSVLILAADSLRSDRIESAEVMPFTSSLAARGRLYPYAYTSVARTVPSWVSALTGLEPRRTDVRTMFPRREPLDALPPTFVSELRDRGYATFVASDFAGDMFPRFDGGFETVDTPHFTVDALAGSTVLSNHSWTLPLLRLRTFRRLLPEWRNLASLSDPEWLADEALRLAAAAGDRPFAGVVFFSNSHFPFVAPYPDYRRGAGGYSGRYLYHAPPTFDAAPDAQDVAQIRARYDGAVRSIDRAIERILAALEAAGRLDRTLVVVMGDHGEDLFERPGIFGHGDVLGMLHSQVTPILLAGPGVPSGRSKAQVRLQDLAATVLGLVDGDAQGRRFGDGVSLLSSEPRPLCVETGVWFWPDRPAALRGRRLVYPAVSELLEILPGTRELGLQLAHVPLVESAKDRGVLLGRRYWHEQLTPSGRTAELVTLPDIEPRDEQVDLEALFESRCVAGDPRLRRFYGAVVYTPAGP